MAKSRTKQPNPDQDLTELHEAVERLTQRIQVLTDAVDEVRDELQWRNNERRDGRQSSSPPFALRSMPSDPTTNDWQLNRVSPEVVAELRSRLESPSAPSPRHPLSHEQLCREIADLRQIVAALVLTAFDGFDEGQAHVPDLILEWASQEFDTDILHEMFPHAEETDLPRAVSLPPSRPAHQATLFSHGEADSV